MSNTSTIHCALKITLRSLGEGPRPIVHITTKAETRRREDKVVITFPSLVMIFWESNFTAGRVLSKMCYTQAVTDQQSECIKWGNMRDTSSCTDTHLHNIYKWQTIQ